MDTAYPAAASALTRGRRRRHAGPRQRHRTTPVTFAEITEVDEDKECDEICGRHLASVSSATDERRRRPDLLDECLGREFAEFRRRRARRERLREPDEPPPASVTSPPGGEQGAASKRASSEPRPVEKPT